ncbi:MAG: DUF819 family protein [Alistipes sp.]|nr:DUF819 family protein [Alistipes sp.]
MLNYLIFTLLFLLLPAFVLWLCRKSKILGKIGPIMLLYMIGIGIGNLPSLPEQMATLQELLPNIMVPLAIPMMLFGCNFSFSDAGLQLKVVVSGFLAVVIAVTVGYLLFGTNVDEGAKIGGIISGMYTGGTLNAAALQTVLKAKEETFVLINSYDILISFLYFVFLFAIGIKLFRRLYGEPTDPQLRNKQEGMSNTTSEEETNSNPYSGLWSKHGLYQLLKVISVTICIVALSAAAALPLPEGWFMIVFILMLTTLGVCASFIKPVRNLKYSYDVGMYLIYIFSLVIATMADFSKFDLTNGLYQIAFMSFAVFASLAIHAIICRLMRVDADSMVISSVAFINSPPFVPMVTVAMRNRAVLVTGLGAGIMGYALGNHLGVLMANLLEMIG